MNKLLSTRPLTHLAIVRIIAAVPLLGIGAMHLTGAAPMRPIIDAAGLPMPALGAIAAPLGEILAGILLVSGAASRLGALLGAAIMAVALYSHIVADWPDEPPPPLPLSVLALCLYITIRGGGRWSIDHRLSSNPKP